MHMTVIMDTDTTSSTCGAVIVRRTTHRETTMVRSTLMHVVSLNHVVTSSKMMRNVSSVGENRPSSAPVGDIAKM